MHLDRLLANSKLLKDKTVSVEGLFSLSDFSIVCGESSNKDTVTPSVSLSLTAQMLGADTFLGFFYIR